MENAVGFLCRNLLVPRPRGILAGGAQRDAQGGLRAILILREAEVYCQGTLPTAGWYQRHLSTQRLRSQ